MMVGGVNAIQQDNIIKTFLFIISYDTALMSGCRICREVRDQAFPLPNTSRAVALAVAKLAATLLAFSFIGRQSQDTNSLEGPGSVRRANQSLARC